LGELNPQGPPGVKSLKPAKQDIVANYKTFLIQVNNKKIIYEHVLNFHISSSDLKFNFRTDPKNIFSFYGF